MKSVLENNAYHVLGLDTSATQKIVQRRSQELLQRLKIDDVPQYPTDFLTDDFRTEERVKAAIQRLQSPRKKFEDFFFWLNVETSVDEEVISLMGKGDLKGAVSLWEQHIEGHSIKSLLTKKNLAILECSLLCNQHNARYLSQSLSLWDSCINSEKFWPAFDNLYKLHNEQTYSEELLEKFKHDVVSHLSDIYTELYELHQNKDYLNEFNALFNVKGAKIKAVALKPALHAIDERVRKLEAMNISEDGVIDEDEKRTLRVMIGNIQTELNKLIDVGMYEDGQAKAIRDRAALAIRSIVLDIHNNLNEVELSQKLMNVALQFAATEGTRVRLKDELGRITDNLDAQNAKLVLEVPGFFSNNDVVLTPTTIAYKGKKINIDQIDTVAWHSVRQSTNGIPTGQTYTYRAVAGGQSINVSFSASIRGGEKHDKLFAQLVGFSNAIIEPKVRKRILDNMFEKHEGVIIGKIHFDHKGIWKKKLFGGFDKILWSNVKYQAKLQQGAVYIFDEGRNGEPKTFATIPMSNDNAILIPELINEAIQAQERAANR